MYKIIHLLINLHYEVQLTVIKFDSKYGKSGNSTFILSLISRRSECIVCVWCQSDRRVLIPCITSQNNPLSHSHSDDPPSVQPRWWPAAAAAPRCSCATSTTATRRTPAQTSAASAARAAACRSSWRGTRATCPPSSARPQPSPAGCGRSATGRSVADMDTMFDDI